MAESNPNLDNENGDTPSIKEWTEFEKVKKIVDECQVPGLKASDLSEEGTEAFHFVRNVRKFWKEFKDEEFKDRFQVDLKLFNDPIHGSIQLNMLEIAIVNTPEFNRLKEIKQLSGKNHVFQGATHTRFEHSIGVCHLAGKFIKHLKERSSPEVTCTEQQVLRVRLAGLCHDLGHGPFSHLFDTVTKHICGDKKLDHEVISGLVFKRILVKHPKVLAIFLKCELTSEDVAEIVDMINCSKEILGGKDSREKYLYEIVANKTSGMDVDKWDYFARDCHYLGLKNEFDMERCIALSSIVKKEGEYHVGFREKELGNIYGMFRTRCILFQKAYLHKTGNGIDLMIKDALLVAQDVKIKLPGSANCTSLEEILIKAMTEKDLDGYVLLTDSFLGALMIMPTEESVEASLKRAQHIVERLSERNIYKAICSLSFYSDKYDLPSKKEREKLHNYYKTEDPEVKGTQHKEKKCYKPGDYEVEIVPIKYASEDAEKSGDPVAGNMYFFKKENNWKVIPEAIENGKGIEMSCSKLILPKAFVEYRITLYYKGENPLNETETKKNTEVFMTRVNNMMSKSMKKENRND